LNLGLVIVEVCSRGAINTQALEQFEEEHPEVAVLREECLNNCELCAVRPFAYVNGKTVAAPTPEGCVERIKRYAGQELQKYEDVDDSL
jgi:uncharacterized protein YuzB (UPF0349 family)